MSIRFDAKVTCNGCGKPRELPDGAQRLREAPIKGGRELVATVAEPCPFCQSTRVKIVATAGLVRG
jgi:LSD1 subclass zinc finger protein